METDFIRHFVNACRDAFDEMMDIQVNSGNPFIPKDKNIFFDISGIISLTGEVKGTIILSFPIDAANTVAARFTRKEDVDINKTYDVIGEIANIIAGNAKNGLQGREIYLSVPHIIMGDNYDIKMIHQAIIVTIPFDFDKQTFNLSVLLQSENDVEVV